MSALIHGQENMLATLPNPLRLKKLNAEILVGSVSTNINLAPSSIMRATTLSTNLSATPDAETSDNSQPQNISVIPRCFCDDGS